VILPRTGRPPDSISGERCWIRRSCSGFPGSMQLVPCDDRDAPAFAPCSTHVGNARRYMATAGKRKLRLLAHVATFNRGTSCGHSIGFCSSCDTKRFEGDSFRGLEHEVVYFVTGSITPIAFGPKLLKIGFAQPRASCIRSERTLEGLMFREGYVQCHVSR
jgi:hypothetical protein